MFRCANEECIPYWWKCDGTPDCSDASDEVECHQGHDDHDEEAVTEESSIGDPATPSPHAVGGCRDNMFRCNDGECIYQAWVCDSDLDCNSGEDESELLCANWTVCGANDFRCELSGECVDASRLCNGVEDCIDR